MSTNPALTAEQRTAIFQARMSRKKAPLLVRLKAAMAGFIGAGHRGRRLAALALAIGVPAMAAPGQWEAYKLANAEVELADTAKPMGFEQPGMSFPGSAFYYIEDSQLAATEIEPRDLAVFDMTGTGDTEAAELVVASKAGPAARAFSISGGGLDKSRALQCLTSAVYYEAASEAIAGQEAVAQVVLNRVAHPSYPNSVCGVVFQGSERKTGCQFSFTCDGSLNRTASAVAWARARSVAQNALSGYVYKPVGLATHYHTIWIYPYWAPSLDPIGTIGAHRFYRWKGNAGQPAAFISRYAGFEPSAAPHPRSATVDDDKISAADPVSLARAFEEARLKAIADAEKKSPQASRAPAPSYSAKIEERGGDKQYTAENLPESSGIKPEYANSGRWIAEPK
ncbi:MAG: cell wall hydrolase [Pontixanthobacter sp.]